VLLEEALNLGCALDGIAALHLEVHVRHDVAANGQVVEGVVADIEY
jgi:hypothetical protein